MATLQPAYESQTTRKPTTRRVGVAIPFAADARGGLARTSGELNDFKTIALALTSGDNNNPWEQRDDDIEQAMFDTDGPQGRALIQRRIENAFAVFEAQHRYRLIPNSVEFRRTRVNNDEILFVYFKYHNLESDQISDLSLPTGAA
jgi:hypothetical protein